MRDPISTQCEHKEKCILYNRILNLVTYIPSIWKSKNFTCIYACKRIITEWILNVYIVFTPHLLLISQMAYWQTSKALLSHITTNYIHMQLLNSTQFIVYDACNQYEIKHQYSWKTFWLTWRWSVTVITTTFLWSLK